MQREKLASVLVTFHFKCSRCKKEKEEGEKKNKEEEEKKNKEKGKKKNIVQTW